MYEKAIINPFSASEKRYDEAAQIQPGFKGIKGNPERNVMEEVSSDNHPRADGFVRTFINKHQAACNPVTVV